jgi:O-methyltransferase involved in polyketide biosynthesis
MAIEKVTLTGTPVTLLMTLYSRAMESRTANPILQDLAAERAIDAIDYDFSRLDIRRVAVVGCAARARQFDEWTNYFLANFPEAMVLHLACGLDGRFERVNPPLSCSWFDVDYPEVINLRRRLFPLQKNYSMVSGSATELDWLDNLPADRPVLVVAEGLTMHLHQNDVQKLISATLDRFPQGELLFDVLNWPAVRVINRRRLMNTVGVRATWGIDDVLDITSWDPRLTLVQAMPTFSVPGVQRKLPLTMRLLTRIPAVRDGSRLLRFTFGVAHRSG